MRKGPEHVPDSSLVLIVAVALFVIAMATSGLLVEPGADDSVIVSVSVSVMGYVLYWMVLFTTGFSRRLLPTISSIMACGSILTVFMVIAYLALLPILGANTASLIAWLILIWSVPVKGHIIARAIEKHWYIGITIALTVYIMQRVAYDAMTVTPGT